MADIETLSQRADAYQACLARLDALRADASRAGLLYAVLRARQACEAKQLERERPQLEGKAKELTAEALKAAEKQDRARYEVLVAELSPVLYRLGKAEELAALEEAWRCQEAKSLVIRLAEANRKLRSLPPIEQWTAMEEGAVREVERLAEELAAKLPRGPDRVEAEALAQRSRSMQGDYQASINRLRQELQLAVRRLRTPEDIGKAHQAFARLAKKKPNDQLLMMARPPLDEATKKFLVTARNLSASAAHRAAISDWLAFCQGGQAPAEVEADLRQAIRAALDFARQHYRGTRHAEAIDLLGQMAQLPLTEQEREAVNRMLKAGR